MSALYLFDRIPAWGKSDYDKIGKRSKYIVTDMSLAANSLGWDEEEVLFDESINGKLAESWAYHEISAQADLAGDYEIFGEPCFTMPRLCSLMARLCICAGAEV